MPIYLTDQDDLYYATSAAEHIIGKKGDDVILGGGGHDTLEGWGGDDVLISHGSGGLLAGNTGDDYLEAKKTSYGQYHMYGGTGDDQLVMHLNNENGWGHQGFHVYGRDQADEFRFVGVETTNAPLLSRIDDFDASQDSIWVDATEIDLYNLPANMRIVDFHGQQWLVIDSNVMIGLEGARMYAPDGVPTMMGGAEEMHFHTFPTNIASLESVEFVDPVNYVPFSLYEQVFYLLNQVSGTTTTSGADYFYDLGGDSSLDFGSGNDVVNAGKGRDTIHGGQGDDLIAGGTDDDILHGGDGNDMIWGGSENDYVYGGAGEDTLYGGSGNDVLIGGSGDDVIDGGDGIDTLDFSTATGRVFADIQIDQRGAGFLAFYDVGQPQGDTYANIENIVGGSYADNLRGDDDVNVLDGGGVSDRLYGRGGNDILNGGAGADALYGGLGADTMTGGSDFGRRDRFIYFNADESGVGAGNRDVITDFVSGEDRIEISRFDADVTQHGMQKFSFVGTAGLSGTAGELAYLFSGGNTIVQADFDGDGLADFEIELIGEITLSADDFLI